MASAFVDLSAAVVAALNTPTPVADLITKGRAFTLPQGADNGVFVRLTGAQGELQFAGTDIADWTVELSVTCLQRAAAGVDGESAVDQLVMDVWSRLAANPSPAGTDAWTVQPFLNWDVEEADQTLSAVELRLTVHHRTASGALTAA